MLEASNELRDNPTPSSNGQPDFLGIALLQADVQ
jgi:hypothetical protein